MAARHVRLSRARRTITWALPWLGGALAGACGGAGAGDDPGDGPTNDGPPAAITVTTIAEPALIAFRDGPSAAWQVPAAATPGSYTFDVHGPYTAQVVCLDGDRAQILELARTPEDPRELAMSCATTVTPAPALRVTGRMEQPGQVALGTAQSVTGGDELQFELAVNAGTFDLVVKTIAEPGEDELVIRRDQVITRSITVNPPIDVAAERLALVQTPYTVTGALPDDTLTVAARLTTKSTSSALASGRTAGTVRVLPSASLLATDRQSIQAQTSRLPSETERRFRFRFVERPLTPGTAAALALPDALDALEFTAVDEQLVARWTTLPAHDGVELAASTLPRILHRKLLSARYLTDTRATSAALETGAPGYQPAWKIDLARAHRRQFITRTTGTDASSLSLAQDDIAAP